MDAPIGLFILWGNSFHLINYNWESSPSITYKGTMDWLHFFFCWMDTCKQQSMKQRILTFLFVVLISLLPLSVSATPDSDSLNTYSPEMVDLVKRIYSTHTLLNNLSLEKQGMFFVRTELTPIPSLCIGYGGIYQVFASFGHGLISGLNYGMIGYRSRFFGGYKWSMSFEVRGGVGTHDFSSLGATGGIDLLYSYKNFDFKCLGFAFRFSKKYGFDEGDLSIGVCYNFRSKKYWDYKLEQYAEQVGWEKARGYDKPKTNPLYNNTPRTEPCLPHTKYGPRSYVDLESLIDKQNDGIVGIYEDVVSGGYELAVIKHGGDYRVIYLSGGNSRCWEFAHLKAELRSSANKGIYKATWYLKNFSTTNNCIVTFDGVTMDVNMLGGHNVYLKMYPKEGSATPKLEPKEEGWYGGTGWALGQGYLVTNYHVIKGSKKILVKGVKGDFSVDYSAIVAAKDEINDIAVLKITDNRFDGFGKIPYAVSTRTANGGEEVFVLGYPLTQQLGNNIKITGGMINATTGYQDEVSTYQISAQVDHGSSGSPMFDNQGNVIGIIQGGTRITENANYAIKTYYLKLLIESAGLNIKLPANNTISNLPRDEKKNRAEKFVFRIEVLK